MFNRKKKKIAQLTESLEAFRDQVRVGNGEIRRLAGQIDELTEKLEQEREHVTALMQANGQFKRELEDEKARTTRAAARIAQLTVDLDTERRNKGELALMLEETQKKLHNAEWREKHYRSGHGGEDLQALKDKVLVEVARDLACPSDCTKHKNPGPGGSVCRNCIRNPRAVDKYTNGTYTPENGKE